MVACLTAFFFAINASNDLIKPSMSDNASAMARCSAEDGTAIRIAANVSRVIPLIDVP